MKRLSEIYNFLYYLGEVIADSAFYPVDTLDNHQVTIDTGPEYVQNIFSRSLQKTSHQRKLRQTT